LKTKRAFKLEELADRLKGKLVGKNDVEVSGLSSLADAGPKDISFYSGPAYADALAKTRAGALLTASQQQELDVPQILVPDPFLAAAELMELFYPPDEPPHEEGVHALAFVADSARIGHGSRVMPFAYIGESSSIGERTTIHPGVKIESDVQLGDDCLIWPNVVIRRSSRIGSRVIIHPGAVIGADGFGYARRDNKFIKLRHVGIVVIEDDVEIGANATVDRGTIGHTLIRRGVKLDNLVHIAHNVQVGEDSVMAAQTGISGSTVIGNRVLMGGQVGLVDHLQIGDDAIFIAQSGVIGDIPPKAKVSGYPARPHRDVLRAQAELRSLGRLRKKVRALEEKLSRILQDK
jgi:UDP-3-O-[3-hydroxymyristoyl] glucosamine N-acyltransferase